MKKLTNILSYLWLLLLMAVTACNDLEEEVGPMHVEEEVELNIQLHVPNMQASTRAQMVITENISSIVAIAFDESDALIKKVDAILSNQNHENHSGTLKIKVPKRTRTIHFLGNYTKESIESITSLETLNSFTTTDDSTMRYWGMTTFDGTTANLPVSLHRNMAKLTLKKNENLTGSCYIAGFVNRNLSGTIVPGGHAVGDSPTIPNNVGKGSYEADNSLGNVYYLFEHVNDKNNSPLYVIIEVKAKYYKVAFAAGDTYFPILRNRAYEITVDGIDEMYAENNYTDAVNSQYPINDLVITSVPMTVSASPTEVLNQSGQTSTVTVTIPEGITELNVPTHDAFTIAPPNGLTAQNGKYIVTPGNNYAFTFTVKEGVQAGDKTISFSGRGKYLKATGSANITLVDEEEPEKEIVMVVANPSATTLNYAANSVEDLLVNVTIPKKVTGLTFSSEDFTIKVVGNELQPTDGAYPITHADDATETTVPIRIRLNDGVNKQTASFTFSGMSDDANVTVQGDTENITLNSNDDANVRWQGNVPLNGNVYATIVPLMYDWFLDGNNFIPVGSKLNLEFTVTGDNTSWLEVFEICGNTENEWNNPVHQFAELNNSNRYTANGNNTLSLTLSEATFTTISTNYRTEFLGETGDENKIALAIRGAGITLTKVSVVPSISQVNKILITAPGAAEGVSNASLKMSYSNQSALEEYTITVTVPDGVTQLNYTNDGFSNVYIDNNNGWYENAPQSIDTSNDKDITLKLRADKNNGAPTITFSANAAENATFTVNRTAGATNSDVVWEGALQFKGYDVNTSKIEIPNNLLQGKLLDDAILTLEYEVVDNGGTIDIYGSASGEWENLRDMADDGEYADNNSSTITLKLNPTIIENIGDDAINMQGDGRVLKKVTLTPPAETPPVVTHSEFTYNFEDSVKFGGWNNNITTDIVYDDVRESNVFMLVVSQNEHNFGQIGISNGDYSGKYTLSLKYKAGSSTGKMNLVFQDEANSYAERGKYVEGDDETLSTSWTEIIWNIDFSEHADQFVIQFEQVDANATFYIDDLKLVRNN